MKNSVLKDALLNAGVITPTKPENIKSSSVTVKTKKQRHSAEQVHDPKKLTMNGFIAGFDTQNNKGFLSAQQAYESEAFKTLKHDFPDLKFRVLKVSIDNNFWIHGSEKVHPKINKKKKSRVDKQKPVIARTLKPKVTNRKKNKFRVDTQDYPLILHLPKNEFEKKALFKESVTLNGTKLLPNHLLCERTKKSGNMLVEKVSLHEQPLNTDKDDHIIIGFDLGTAGTKVVFRDHNKNIAYAIPFLKGGDNDYILPSCVFQTDNIFSITSGEKKQQGFKLDLIENGKLAKKSTCFMVAFMALVLRMSLVYFFEKFNDLYGKSNIDWELNFGMPVDSMQDEQLVLLFRKIAIAGCQLGLSKSDITLHKVAEYLDLAEVDINMVMENDQSQFTQLGADMVGVSPEITAQIKGFLQSRQWDKKKNRMMLIDVGGSTVDASYFVITGTNAEPQYNIYGACVLTKGALVLHQQRISWLRKELKIADIKDVDIFEYIDNVEELDSWLSKLPESVHDYISSVSFTLKTDIDNSFTNSLGEELTTQVVNEGRKKSGIRQEFNDIPLFFCGGASDLNLYKSYVDTVNNNKNYAVSFIVQKLKIPNNFIAPGLNGNDFHRLSVAFGLAHDIDELTSIVLPKDVTYIAPNIQNRESKEFISKDMC